MDVLLIVAVMGMEEKRRRELRKTELAGFVRLDQADKVSSRLDDGTGRLAVEGRCAEARHKVNVGAAAFAETFVRKATRGG